MKVLCQEQRTDEWNQAHKCRISASEAHKCLMGKGTKGRRLYVEKIADDLEGLPDFGDHETAPWFIDGIQYESWAIGWYQFNQDVDVKETGFVVHDDYDWIGCSPDGLVGFDDVVLEKGVTFIPSDASYGLVEAKYRKSLKSFLKHTEGSFTTAHQAQMQTQMFVTGTEWVDYLNYWRWDAEELERGHVRRIYRDQAYIDNTLLPAFVSFMADVGDEVKRRELQRKAAAQ